MAPDPFAVALAEVAVRHGQAIFCDPTIDEPPCDACTALFVYLRHAAMAPLLADLDGLMAQMDQEHADRYVARKLSAILKAHRPPAGT
jgi:hypothetical protein